MSDIVKFKYNNPDEECAHPKHPEGDPIDYCWSYALWVDDGSKDYEKFKDEHCRNGCELWRKTMTNTKKKKKV